MLGDSTEEWTMPERKDDQARGRNDDRRRDDSDNNKNKSRGSEGGKASGGNFKNDPQRAAEAGRKGGKS